MIIDRLHATILGVSVTIVAVIALVVGITLTNTQFTDIADDEPLASEIEWMGRAKISEGWEQPDGTRLYKPQDKLQRAAFIKFIYELVGAPSFNGVRRFNDVPTDNPFAPALAWAREKNIVIQDGDGATKNHFHPYAPIRRAHMAVMMRRACDEYESLCAPTFGNRRVANSDSFKDVGPQATWPDARNAEVISAVAWMKDTGISTGYSDNTFKPSAPVTRDAAAAFFFRMINANTH